jgi:hypothetical protein
MTNQTPLYTAFEGTRLLASGGLRDVAMRAKQAVDQGDGAAILIFDDRTSQPIELDLNGPLGEVLDRLAPLPSPQPRRPGRPKLGVVAREVTLLPRHWEWLATQSGGASVALRKLVEEAANQHSGEGRRRLGKEACYRFMHIMASDRPGFEDSVRALYANDSVTFTALTEVWPADIGDHARRLAAPAFA